MSRAKGYAQAAEAALVKCLARVEELVDVEAPSEGELRRMKALMDVVGGLSEVVGGAEVLKRRSGAKGNGDDDE